MKVRINRFEGTNKFGDTKGIVKKSIIVTRFSLIVTRFFLKMLMSILAHYLCCPVLRW